MKKTKTSKNARDAFRNYKEEIANEIGLDTKKTSKIRNDNLQNNESKFKK